jgi:hypothetical protein
MKFAIGDRVVRNPATWKPNEFDQWGRGRGVGVVIEPPFHMDDSVVDVRWPCGRCLEEVAGLLPAPQADERAPEADTADPMRALRERGGR